MAAIASHLIDDESEPGSWRDAMYWRNNIAPPSYQKQIGGDHYRTKAIQPWEAMQAWMTPEQFTGYLRGNAIKYLARAGSKGEALEDYRKAQHYLDKLIEALTEK